MKKVIRWTNVGRRAGRLRKAAAAAAAVADTWTEIVCLCVCEAMDTLCTHSLAGVQKCF